jgi:branched-chain amino acid transport system permease protein
MSNTTMLAFTSDYKILTTDYSSSSFNVAGISVSTPLAIYGLCVVNEQGDLVGILTTSNILDALISLCPKC